MTTREEIMHFEERLRQAEIAPAPSFFPAYLAGPDLLPGLAEWTLPCRSRQRLRSCQCR
jgi:hypothetical protein